MDTSNKRNTSIKRPAPAMQRDKVISPNRPRPLLFHARVTGFDRWLARTMLRLVGNPPCKLILWDGTEINPEIEDAIASVRFASRWAIWKTLVNPELNWGDLYCSGQVECEGDLPKFLASTYLGLRQKHRQSRLRRLISWIYIRRISNSPEKSADNIHHHYDIGNQFYRLWLDTEVMQYTCAYFPDPALTLEQAQVAKLNHICRKLQLKPGDSVVEAGCGWGGLALFMARNYGVKVRAYNISREQVDYARQRAREEGLSDQVEYVLEDYRNISGEYDVFVSVGMLEHVGKRDYPLLGAVIDRCLKPQGRGLIHSIGRISPRPMNGWIERRIFPGAYPPSLQEMMTIFEPRLLSVLDVENLRLHYAKTLEHWLQRFEQHRDTIEAMMDDDFVKAWRLYLAGSIAAFDVGELQLYQVVFARNSNNNIPWTRGHLYHNPTESRARLTLVPSGDGTHA